MKHILALITTLVLVSCEEDRYNYEQPKYNEKTGDQDYEFIRKPQNKAASELGYQFRIYTLKDTKTGLEYIVVFDGNCIAITRRIN